MINIRIIISVSLWKRNQVLNNKYLYEAIEASYIRKEIISLNALDDRFINEISCLVDLTRIQWVNPVAARMISDSGCKNVESVSAANAEELCKALEEANDKKHYSRECVC